jgi:hypothetical protein
MVFSINPTNEKTGAAFQALAIKQKGTGAGTGITGNATSSAIAGGNTATPSAVIGAPATTPGNAAGAIATGTGSFDPATGVCSCACALDAGFPAAAQGIGAFGGSPGSLPRMYMERAGM